MALTKIVSGIGLAGSSGGFSVVAGVSAWWCGGSISVVFGVSRDGLAWHRRLRSLRCFRRGLAWRHFGWRLRLLGCRWRPLGDDETAFLRVRLVGRLGRSPARSACSDGRLALRGRGRLFGGRLLGGYFNGNAVFVGLDEGGFKSDAIGVGAPFLAVGAGGGAADGFAEGLPDICLYL